MNSEATPDQAPPWPQAVSNARLSTAFPRRRWRLLPTDPDLGYWPIVNLVYLFFVFLPLLFKPTVQPEAWVLSIVATLVFLPLHFAGFRLARQFQWLVIAAIAAIGYALIPVNPGGNTFLIYSLALAAGVLPPLRAAVVAVVVLAGMALEIWWFGQPWPFLAMTAVLGGIVAIGVAYNRQVMQRNVDLRLSQDEVRRLAALAERERIARDLHDLLGHTLSVVALKSELAARLIERGAPEAIAEVRAVESIAREALKQVREAVGGMRSKGLQAELAQARVAAESADLRLSYRIADIELAPEAERVLTFAAREGLTNVLRHANATLCEVELLADSRQLQLELRDDGRGGIGEPGHGLRGMRERIEALGGELAIESEPGRGTRLKVRLPRVMAEGPADLPATAAGDRP